VRTSLGEPLCIWWLGRVLSQTKPVWKATRGPLKIDKLEVDAASALASQKQFAVAEVKVSKLQSKLKEALSQVVRAARFFMEPGKVERAGFTWVKGPCTPSEVAVATSYNLGGDKEALKRELKRLLEEDGLPREATSVYDIGNIFNALKGWQSQAKGRYLELFETLNKILEAT